MKMKEEHSQNNSKVRFVEVDSDYEGQRIDNYLRNQLKGVPKSLIYRILRKGEVRVNKKRSKVSYRVKLNDNVRVPPNIYKNQLISRNIISDSTSYIEYENQNFILKYQMVE